MRKPLGTGCGSLDTPAAVRRGRAPTSSRRQAWLASLLCAGPLAACDASSPQKPVAQQGDTAGGDGDAPAPPSSSPAISPSVQPAHPSYVGPSSPSYTPTSSPHFF